MLQEAQRHETAGQKLKVSDKTQKAKGQQEAAHKGGKAPITQGEKCIEDR